MFRRLLILILLFATSAVWAQRLLTTPDISAFSLRDGVGLPSLGVRALPDGGTLIYGKFEVWYEGKRFRDILRLKPGGDPDTAWRMELEAAGSDSSATGVSSVTVTPHGVFLLGTFNKINGKYVNQWPLLVYDSPTVRNGSTEPVASTIGFATTLSNYDLQAEHVYILMSQRPGWTEGTIRRISAKTGAMDPSWALTTGISYGSSNVLVADSAGGLWRTDSNTYFMFTDYFARRYAIADAGTLDAPKVTWARSVIADEVFFANSDEYTYVGARRFKTGSGEQDPDWTTKTTPTLATSDYVFFPTRLNRYSPIIGFTRASARNLNAVSNWTFTIPPGYFGGPVMPWATAGDNGNLAMLAWLFVDNQVKQTAFMVRDDQTIEADPVVVEYYAPALKHYFLTGRKNEQAALDALPQSFTRTGMKFTAKSSRYRDIPEQPVCRLYASPEKGLSNSHFYGVGDDCVNLNKLTGLKYEGFDFSVLKPTSSGCSADAPNAVSRLFNNKAASNDGNHRYVVSAATKAKMLAQGWVDEGAVFCSASVTDALN